MPEVGKIQSTNFQSLLTDLGISRNNIPFALRSEVTPVVLVGGTVSFIAAATPAYAVTDWFTAGELTAPIINTVMADTGQLPAGSYTCYIMAMSGDGKRYRLEWRDAPNTATLRSQLLDIAVLDTKQLLTFRFNVENNNERVRVIITEAGTAAVLYQVTILAKI